MLYDDILDGRILSESLHEYIYVISLLFQLFFPVAGNVVFNVFAGNKQERHQ